MRIVEFYCTVCNVSQEKWLKRLDSENTERCDHCNSPPDKLKRMFYRPMHKHHMSWSKWKI